MSATFEVGNIVRITNRKHIAFGLKAEVVSVSRGWVKVTGDDIYNMNIQTGSLELIDTNRTFIDDIADMCGQDIADELVDEMLNEVVASAAPVSKTLEIATNGKTFQTGDRVRIADNG